MLSQSTNEKTKITWELTVLNKISLFETEVKNSLYQVYK